MKPTLLILAAGMGSRFGGLKQVEPVGPGGEAIIDYSVFDAIRAGFGKIVFIIRKNFAEVFKKRFEEKLKGKIEVEYVFQELNVLPDGFTLPEGREKPWGTAHAVLVAKDVINEPFCALNADDFYGSNAYNVMAKYLTSQRNENEFSMVGYFLKNTLSDFGSVSRGICDVDSNQHLVKIVETHKIEREGNQIVSNIDGIPPKIFTGNEIVSMNMWGFQPSIFKIIESKFKTFLREQGNEKKSEMYIPKVVFEMIEEKKTTVKVLEANSPWFGVTYKKDKPFVVEKIRALINSGEYPENLWK